MAKYNIPDGMLVHIGEVVIEVDVNDVPFRWVARGRFVELWWKPRGEGEWEYCHHGRQRRRGMGDPEPHGGTAGELFRDIRWFDPSITTLIKSPTSFGSRLGHLMKMPNWPKHIVKRRRRIGSRKDDVVITIWEIQPVKLAANA